MSILRQCRPFAGEAVEQPGAFQRFMLGIALTGRLNHQCMQTARIPHLKNPDALWRKLKWTGLPETARRALMRRFRKWASPGEAERRRALAAPVVKAAAIPALRALEASGYCRVDPELCPGAPAIASAMHALYLTERARDSASPSSAGRKGQFLRTLKRDADFLDFPEVLQFASAGPLIELAATYLGEAPVLSSLQLWWSPVNATAMSSQLYHFDEEDDRQIKFFLNCIDVGPEHGPLSLVPAEVSARIAQEAGTMHGRFPDEIVAKHLNGGHATSLAGPAGTVAALDTSRCLHYGSRGNTADRVVLMIQFTRFSAPQGPVPNWGDRIATFAHDKPALTRRAFQLS
jgi:hypothetical protein